MTAKQPKNTWEECPYCGDEVLLKYKFKVQQCPNCHVPILACSICEYEYDEELGNRCMKCSTCPLDELLKEAWIDKVMSTVY